jgi:hypothetical protein
MDLLRTGGLVAHRQPHVGLLHGIERRLIIVTLAGARVITRSSRDVFEKPHLSHFRLCT